MSAPIIKIFYALFRVLSWIAIVEGEEGPYPQ
jgi:hypothetical protein